MARTRFNRIFGAAALLLSGLAFGGDSNASAQTVIDMPPPPTVADTEPRPLIDDDPDAPQQVTWRDQVERNAIDSDQRSYLGVVALTRFARARGGTYNSYIARPRPFHHGGFVHDPLLFDFGFPHHGLHFPGIDVSFLHGVPIGHGYQFGIRFPHHGCWW